MEMFNYGCLVTADFGQTRHNITVTCLVVTKEIVSMDTKSTIVTCLVVTKELVGSYKSHTA
jgi:hypothetical protein